MPFVKSLRIPVLEEGFESPDKYLKSIRIGVKCPARGSEFSARVSKVLEGF